MPISRLALALACAAFVIHGAAHAMVATARSTPIEGKQCKTVSDNRETGDTVKRCPGVSGYSLLVHHSDDRASISKEKRWPLPLLHAEVRSPTPPDYAMIEAAPSMASWVMTDMRNARAM